MSPMPRMPLRTRVVAQVIRYTARGDVTTYTEEEIRRQRRSVVPTRWPYTLITGSLARSVRISETTFEARDAVFIPVRVYRPEHGRGALPVVVFLHGGGWVLGSTRRYDPLCSALADGVGAVVASVDYRMAPEHKAPRAVFDCVDAIRWVGAGGLGDRTDATRIAVAGDSAGANLSASATVVLRDEGGPTLAHQALIYPAVDATCSFPSVREHADAPILTRAQMDAFIDHYVDGSDIPRTDPLISPLWAPDHHGLPPALVQTAEFDPLHDEGLAYAETLRRAGVRVRSTSYLGVPHGFASFPGATTVGMQARAELIGELRRHLHPEPSGVEPAAGPRVG